MLKYTNIIDHLARFCPETSKPSAAPGKKRKRSAPEQSLNLFCFLSVAKATDPSQTKPAVGFFF